MTQAISLGTTTTIHSAIASAAAKTGVDFDYLLDTAKRESSLQTQAKSKTSSASGLFQFIDQTWLSMVKKHGLKHDLGNLSDKIERDAKGRFNVADPAAKEEILALRHDPKTASLMAGELTRDAANALQSKLGRAASKGELYMAHFLGASGAARFISAAEANPDARAAESFGREAAANRSVFFEGSGKMRSLSDVYTRLTHMHEGGKSSIPPSAQTPQPPTALPTATSAPAPVSNYVSAYTSHATQAMPSHFSLSPGNISLGGLTSRLTPQVLMILSSLNLPFGDD